MAIRKKVLGPEHPDTLMSQINFTSLLRASAVVSDTPFDALQASIYAAVVSLPPVERMAYLLHLEGISAGHIPSRQEIARTLIHAGLYRFEGEPSQAVLTATKLVGIWLYSARWRLLIAMAATELSEE